MRSLPNKGPVSMLLPLRFATASAGLLPRSYRETLYSSTGSMDSPHSFIHREFYIHSTRTFSVTFILDLLVCFVDEGFRLRNNKCLVNGLLVSV